jgi:glycosyltransferase involved in cell wall biosynthesis
VHATISSVKKAGKIEFMKIVQLITLSEPFGGAQAHVRDLSRGLIEIGHDVTVLVGSEGLFTLELKRLGIPYRVIPNLIRSIHLRHDLLALTQIRSALAEIGPDILAIHSSKAGWLGRIAGWTLGIPTVFTAHGWAFTEGVSRAKARIYSLAEKIVAPLTSRIIAVSKYDQQLAVRKHITTEKNIVAIHNGVPDKPELLANPTGNPPKLLMVARFQAPKDHTVLCKALAKLKGLEWSLDFVGDGPLMPEIVSLVASLGIKDRVNFLGERKDVPQLLSKAQVFVLTTNWEGFPISIVEAMRANLPVIASDVGGISEAVVDNVTGYLVPRGNLDVLVDRLSRILSDAKLRGEFGAAGRAEYIEEFTFKKMVAKVLTVYEEMLEHAKVPTNNVYGK